MTDPLSKPETISVGDVPFANSTLGAAVDWVLDAAARASRAPTPIHVCLSNAYCVALASRDTAYKNLLHKAVVYPDGRPVVWFMRWSSRSAGQRRPRQVRGPSLFQQVLEEGQAQGVRHFFYGTNDETLDRLRAAVEPLVGHGGVAGMLAPPYGPLSESHLDEAAALMRRSGAQLIWVALGTPKQDFIGAELSRRTELPCLGVGAAFDFLSGMASEAPMAFRNLGLEWLYRLVREPRRLWRRYLIGNVRFLWAASKGLLSTAAPRP
ncbi:WecB/TagA/CpsF family glycosyltransferase [Blastococcus sp. SYSU D00813]